MKHKRILTDVDGVLLNWEDSFHEWMYNQGYLRVLHNEYDMWNCYPALSKHEAFNLIKTFNASAHMGYLPAIDDSIYYVRKMHEKHGVKFTCITSMGDDFYAGKLRRTNLKRLFGNAIDEVIILPCGTDKTLELSKYQYTNLTWLEDHVGNALIGKSLGLDTYLFNRSYNNNTTSTQAEYEIQRINNWEELYNRLFS